MRKRRAGGTAALVLLSLLAGCGASGPEVAGSGLEEVLWRVDAPLETGETASLLENSRGQRLLLVGEETVLEVDAPFGQDTQMLTPDLDGDGREEVVLVSEAGPEGEITLSGVWWDGAGWRELSGPDEPPTVALEEPFQLVVRQGEKELERIDVSQIAVGEGIDFYVAAPLELFFHIDGHLSRQMEITETLLCPLPGGEYPEDGWLDLRTVFYLANRGEFDLVSQVPYAQLPTRVTVENGTFVCAYGPLEEVSSR